MAGEAELVDVVLTERLTLAEVRARLAGHLPDGDRLIDLFDVWLGEPPLAARLAAADYRVDLRSRANRRARPGLRRAARGRQPPAHPSKG